MTRDQRRRLLLRAHAAGKRFCKKAEADPYFRPATDAFVAGWLLGYRAYRRDIIKKVRDAATEIENRDLMHRMWNPPDEGPTGDDNMPTSDD